MTALFVYGTLRHGPLLEAVLGKAIRTAAQEAVLHDHVVLGVDGDVYPTLIAQPGQRVDGLILEGLTPGMMDRLAFYEGGFGYSTRAVTVHTSGRTREARVFFPDGPQQTGGPWSLQRWREQAAGYSVDAAHQIMARFGQVTAAQIAPLRPFLHAQAWARQIGQQGAPTTLRRDGATLDIEVTPDSDAGHAGFFGLSVFDLSHRRFDGTRAAPVRRECFVAYDAALVLPFDAQSDTVLLIEQMRYGPVFRSDPHASVLEPIAGLVDAGEDPAETARREAREEAGLALGDLIAMPRGYASPGYSTEFFHCFLALADLSGVQAGVGGLASENEDIRSHILSFDDAMALVDSGEITALPLVTMLLWLSRWRATRLESAARGS